MNDLLTDSFVSDAKIQRPPEGDVEMGERLPRSNSDMGLEAFNKQIQEVEKQVHKLSSLLKKLKDSNEESKTVTKASAMKERNVKLLSNQKADGERCGRSGENCAKFESKT